jgi:GT2 family glycosyltransferase
MPDFPTDVAVAIVSHDNLGPLPKTLDSLAAAGCPPSQIAVVDVASTDGTGDWLRANWPAITQHRLEKNDGPSPGRNVGILKAERPFVFLMDADVFIRPDTVQLLKAEMDRDPNVKIGSPIVVHASRPDVIQYAGGALHYICEAVNPWMDRPLGERGPEPRDIGAAPTCALLLDRAAAVEIGLFDERYFIGKEDGDFTHRCKVAGYTMLELPAALVLHHSRPRGTWLFYYQIRNRWHFMLKNYQWSTLFLIIPPLLVHEPLQAAVLIAKGHGRVYVRALWGLIRLLPDLGKDRAVANRIRRRRDADLLVAGALVIRDDLAKNPIVRSGRALYEGFLNGYWRLLKATVWAR